MVVYYMAETASMAQAILSTPHPLDTALVVDLYAQTMGNPLSFVQFHQPS